jgi:hypothetical protein
MIILVTGGRDYNDETAVKEALRPYAEVGNILIQGGADGADTLAHRLWTKLFQLPSVTVPAAWSRMGRAAGPARNVHMVRGTSLAPYCDLVPDLVIAFPGNVGTPHCIKEAKKRNITVIEP